MVIVVGVYGFCIIGSNIFVKCFKNWLKVVCMLEIIDMNIFWERNIFYINLKINNIKVIDNYCDD